MIIYNLQYEYKDFDHRAILILLETRDPLGCLSCVNGESATDAKVAWSAFDSMASELVCDARSEDMVLAA